MEQPNLFRFATSELSQDAFICWLLAWASPKNKDIDTALHNCGLELIKVFFKKHGKPLPSVIEKIEVRKQDSNIDILCIVNNKLMIIIEDKTHTTNHDDQLAKYLSEIEKRACDKNDIFPIYFKTYDQACYKNVIEKNKYQVFSRSDFLSILNNGNYIGINNAIFQDFRQHLQLIEDKVQNYLNMPISPNNKWHSQSWVGFYLNLQKELGTGLWKKVNNEAGGFMGFWLGYQGGENCKPYLQLEENKLCFKIKVDDPAERKKLRNNWYKSIKSKCSDFELDLIKPARFGSGRHMTVIVAKEDYRTVKQDGCIDMVATVNNLKKAQLFLHAIQKSV